MTTQPTLPAIPWPAGPDPWRALRERLDLIERAQQIALTLGNDQIGWGLRAALMAALAEVVPAFSAPDDLLDDWNAEDDASDAEVSSDLVEIVAHLEERARYAEDQRVRAETARRAAQSELRAAVARGVRLWEAGAVMASEAAQAREAARTPMTVVEARQALQVVAKEQQRQRKARRKEHTESHRESLVRWERLSETHREVLRAVAEVAPPTTEVGEATGRGKSSVYSLLSELARTGWVDRPERGTYVPTDKARQRLPLQPEAEATGADEAQAVEPAAAAAPVRSTGRRRVASGSPDGIDPATRTESVLNHLRTLDAPARTSQIAAALGQPERQVGDALYRLQRQGEVVKVDGAWALDAPEAPAPDLLDEVVALLTLQGEPQPFEALVGRVGVGRATLSAALNDLVRRGVVVASAGVYSLTCQQQQRQRLKIYDGSGRVEQGPLAVVEVMPGGYRVVSPEGLAQDLGGRLLPSRDAVMVEGERWRSRMGRAS